MSDVVWTAVSGTVTFALGAGALWCVQRATGYARKSKREYDTDLIRELTRRWWSLVHSPETGKWWVTKVNPDNPDKPEFIASHARWQVAIMDAIQAARNQKEGRP
jgi:hypothetical protein